MSNPTAVSSGDDVLAAWGNDVISRVAPIFATTAARDTAMPSPEEGRLCYVATENTLYVYRGGWLGLVDNNLTHHEFTIQDLAGANNSDLAGLRLATDVPTNAVKLAAHRYANSGQIGARLSTWSGAPVLALDIAPNGNVTIPGQLQVESHLVVGDTYGSGNPGVYFEITGGRSDIYWTDGPAGTNAVGVTLADKGGGKFQFYRGTFSSERYKTDVAPLTGDLTSERLLHVPVVQARYRDDYLDPEDDRYRKLIPTITAEALHAQYPIAVDTDVADKPLVPNPTIVMALLLDLVQHQAARVDTLETRVAALETAAS